MIVERDRVREVPLVEGPLHRPPPRPDKLCTSNVQAVRKDTGNTGCIF